MKRHYIDDRTVLLSFSACGIWRGALDPKQETRVKKKATCKTCRRVLKARNQ